MSINPKNAEVTARGVRKKGDEYDPMSYITIRYDSHMGRYKKYAMAAITGVMSSAGFIGLYASWEAWMVHPTYVLAGLTISQLGLILLTKME